MSRQITIRLPDDQIEFLDDEVGRDQEGDLHRAVVSAVDLDAPS